MILVEILIHFIVKKQIEMKEKEEREERERLEKNKQDFERVK